MVEQNGGQCGIFPGKQLVEGLALWVSEIIAAYQEES